MIEDDTLVAQFQDDYTQAPLSSADKEMLEYVAKLTRTPAAIEKSDVEGLRRVGFSDRAILDVAQITAYFAFVTRMADGLGVTLEDYWTEDKDQVICRLCLDQQTKAER